MSQNVRIQILHGTTTDWTSGKYANLILKRGEPALNTDTGEVRYGDGDKIWGGLSSSSSGGGTAVSVGGVYQNVWDADTKLDKVTDATTYPQIYVKAGDGTQTMYNVSTDIVNGAIPRRTTNGDVLIPNVSVSPYGAVNKNYVTDNFLAKPIATGIVRFNVTDGTTSTYGIYQSAPGAQQIPLAKTGGRITTNTPTEDLDCVNLAYIAPTVCSVTLNDGDNNETYTTTIPAFMKQTLSAYVGACCDTDENHVIVGYSRTLDAFIVADLTDNTHTSIDQYNIQ